MAEYISTLTGAEMDKALTDMNNHISEAWAVGERNGNAVPPSDETYHNNAKYYANLAQSAVPIGAEGAVLWTEAQNLNEEGKAQARANIGAINGNVIANKGWNQLFTMVSAVSYGINTSFNSGTVTITGTTTGTYFLAISSANSLIHLISGHKYYIKLHPTTGFGVRVADGGSSYDAVNITNDSIYIPTHSGVLELYKTGFTVGTSVNYTFKPQIIDLTALFGAGNEPSSVEEFKSMFPNDYYEYYPIGGFISNRNLLDNWWFGNGVINQRGASSYTAAGYTIDRWKITSSAVNLTVNSDHITVTANNTRYNGLYQQIENVQEGRYTLSVKTNVGIYSYTFSLVKGTAVNIPAGWYGVSNTYSYLLLDANNVLTVYIVDCVDNNSVSVDLYAAKLELGSVSTLANDVAPNYAEELAKCQRYCKVFVPAEHLGIGYARTTTRADVVVSTHLRALPSATMTGNVILNKADGTSINTTNNTVPEIYGANGSFTLRFYTTGATQSEILRFTINTDSKLILSADL